jgi:hypothetical protein
LAGESNGCYDDCLSFSLLRTRTNTSLLFSADTRDRVARASIEALATDTSLVSASDSGVNFIDGGIIGGPPALKQDPNKPRNNNVTSAPEDAHAWSRPSIPTSGPIKVSDALVSGPHLAETLNIKHVNDVIGAASGLKCCFASTTKGATALCIQAFTTASRLGVLPELQEEMSTRIPGMFKFAQGMTNVPPKAYRWVREMEEIAVTHAEDGGFDGGEGMGVGHGIFDAVAEVYRSIAEDTVLGEETTERRKRGLTTGMLNVHCMIQKLGNGAEASVGECLEYLLMCTQRM